MHPRFPHLAQRLFNTPVAITPDKAEVIIAAIGQRIGVTKLVHLDGHVVAMSGEDDDEYLYGGAAREPQKGYDTVAGVAVIQVEGTLVQKSGIVRPWSGMTGYDGIRQNLLTALADKQVEAIVLDVDSPGGEVAGCFDLADTIYAARKKKPIWAICSENAYSAAYALASSAERVIVPRTGGVGSIGVICMHVDFSKALDKMGVAVTLLKYGEFKDDGSDMAPLTKGAFDRAMRDINAMGALFDELVARNRNIAAEKVKGFNAATFMGPRGVAAGLADAVQSPDAALRSLIKSL